MKNVLGLKFVWIVRHVMDGKQRVNIAAIAIAVTRTKTFENKKRDEFPSRFLFLFYNGLD